MQSHLVFFENFILSFLAKTELEISGAQFQQAKLLHSFHRFFFFLLEGPIL